PCVVVRDDVLYCTFSRLGDDSGVLVACGHLKLELYRKSFNHRGHRGAQRIQNTAYSRNSRLPSPPRIGESTTSVCLQPNPTSVCRTFSTAADCAASSRTIPPFPTCSRPASN